MPTEDDKKAREKEQQRQAQAQQGYAQLAHQLGAEKKNQLTAAQIAAAAAEAEAEETTQKKTPVTVPSEKTAESVVLVSPSDGLDYSKITKENLVGKGYNISDVTRENPDEPVVHFTNAKGEETGQVRFSRDEKGNSKIYFGGDATTGMQALASTYKAQNKEPKNVRFIIMPGASEEKVAELKEAAVAAGFAPPVTEAEFKLEQASRNGTQLRERPAPTPADGVASDRDENETQPTTHQSPRPGSQR